MYYILIPDNISEVYTYVEISDNVFSFSQQGCKPQLASVNIPAFLNRRVVFYSSVPVSDETVHLS